MICRKINPQSLTLEPESLKLQFNQSSRTIELNSKPVHLGLPVGLHVFDTYVYLYLNPAEIVVVHIRNLYQICDLFHRTGICWVKVPDIKTQMLAQCVKNQCKDERMLVHCGALDQEQDCFIIVDKQGIQVRDGTNTTILKSELKKIQYNDNLKMIELGDCKFYFWKQLQFMQAKLLLSDFYQETLIYVPPVEAMIEQSKEHQQIKQSQMEKIGRVKNQQNNQEQEENIKSVNELVPPKKHIKKQQKNSTNKKQDSSKKPRRKRQQTTARKNNNNNEQQQGSYISDSQQEISEQVTPKNINFEQSQQQSESFHLGDFLTSAIKLALESYSKSQYQVELVCLNGGQVIDIKSKNQKQYLYQHIFNNQKDQATSEQRCELKFTNQNGEDERINSTKLVFDTASNSAYYNDTERGYIHCFNFKTLKQTSHFVTSPVLDMAQHKNGSLLAIHNNEIFEFDTKNKKKSTVAKYKTVKNLSKISSAFGEFYYATSSTDGMVRTYDLRTKQKALNKFRMAPGITSLQVSDEGSYILCRYGHKAHILSCRDKNQQASVFQSRINHSDRKNARKLMAGYEHLSHIQFLHGSETEGDIMAVDDTNPCQLVIKNVQLSTSEKKSVLANSGQQVQYLNCVREDQWVIYGVNGTYYRQKINANSQ